MRTLVYVIEVHSVDALSLRSSLFRTTSCPAGSSTTVGNSRLSGGYGPGPSRADVCLEVAAVVELTELGSTGPVSVRKPIMACGGDPRESHVLLSQSHRILVEMHNPKMIHSVGTFVLHYAGYRLNINHYCFCIGQDVYVVILLRHFTSFDGKLFQQALF